MTIYPNTTSLKNRTGAEWRALIDQLPKELQQPVAYVVWWQFFGGREVKDRWPHLDDLLGIVWPWPEKVGSVKPIVFNDQPKEDIIQALIQLGYTEKQARVRLAAKLVIRDRPMTNPNHRHFTIEKRQTVTKPQSKKK